MSPFPILHFTKIFQNVGLSNVILKWNCSDDGPGNMWGKMFCGEMSYHTHSCHFPPRGHFALKIKLINFDLNELLLIMNVKWMVVKWALNGFCLFIIFVI